MVVDNRICISDHQVNVFRSDTEFFSHKLNNTGVKITCSHIYSACHQHDGSILINLDSDRGRPSSTQPEDAGHAFANILLFLHVLPPNGISRCPDHFLEIDIDENLADSGLFSLLQQVF